MKFLLSFLLLVIGISISHAQSAPASFAYVLQADALAKSKAEAVATLAACGRDWIVLDARFSTDEPWTEKDLSAIRAGKAGRKVIAYLSIGEAEDYRAYCSDQAEILETETLQRTYAPRNAGKRRRFHRGCR